MIYDANTTVADALRAWDAGGAIWSVEMGGLGPGYEQAIQLLVVELLREYDGKPLPEKDEEWEVWGDACVGRLNATAGGFSGAQVGAAKNCAARMLKIGYGHALCEIEGIDATRLIQVSSRWPAVAS